MPTSRALATGLSWFDLLFVGRPNRVACAVVASPGSVALVDPGPTSCLDVVEASLASQGLSLSAVTHLLLTHIHLDHAGATGTILRRHPHIKVVVHARGAKHLVDPSRLLDSATRLYGDAMDRLWGECAPVPESSLVVCHGGERVEAGGRVFSVAYTPGHASHHVSYFDPSSGVAFVGDTAGVCVEGGYVLPPTPPPDIDVELWKVSAEAIAAWDPDTLFLTHFGPVTGGRRHLHTLIENLETSAGFVRESLAEPGTDDERRGRFEAQVRGELRKQMPDEHVAAYESAAGFTLMWGGLARYWRKRDASLAGWR